MWRWWCPEPLSREYTIPMNRFSHLTVPRTCKKLKLVSVEHQTRLDRVTRPQIPRPRRHCPFDCRTPKRDYFLGEVGRALGCTTGRVRGSRSLSFHCFNMQQEDSDEEEPTNL